VRYRRSRAIWNQYHLLDQLDRGSLADELRSFDSCDKLTTLSPHSAMPYTDIFKDHLAHPRNAGELTDANAIAEETNPVCGDRLRLSLRIRDERIAAARFLAYGCPPTLVCGSALAEMLPGLSRHQALALTRQNILDEIGGLSSRKQHAAALAIETLQAALTNHAPAKSD
jgi:nitrogen fixation NifU-like protein